MDYKKLIGESVKDYKIRLCSNKDLYGISFQKITELVNKESGESKSESTYRRWWQAYKEGYSDAEKNIANSAELLEEYERSYKEKDILLRYTRLTAP